MIDILQAYGWLTPVAEALAAVVIAVGLIQVLVYLVQLLIAASALSRNPPEKRSLALWRRSCEVTPPIAILVPAYNEQSTVVESVRSLLALQYPVFEVVVINDGSRDATLATLIEAFQLAPVTRSYESSVAHVPIRGLYGSPEYPRLLVIDKANGGKADALNAGINLCRAPLFCAVDADSMLEADALLRAVQPFVDDPIRTVAVGGAVRTVNGCTVRRGRVVRIDLPRRLLPLLQTVEYLRAFLMGRLAWERLRALTLISGAFGIFRRQVAVDVGGYSRATVGEDLEIIMRIHRWMLDRKVDYRIHFVPEPVCWTEVPEHFRVLARQRIRWQRGALETFFRYKDMLLRPRYGRIGTLGLVHMLIVDVLGPPIEVLGYLLLPLFWMFGLLHPDQGFAYLAVTFTFGVFLSIATLILEEMELQRFSRPAHLLLLTGIAIVENFGYRQINNFWRVVGWWRFAKGVRHEWGEMTRSGFKKLDDSSRLST